MLTLLKVDGILKVKQTLVTQQVSHFKIIPCLGQGHHQGHSTQVMDLENDQMTFNLNKEIFFRRQVKLTILMMMIMGFCPCVLHFLLGMIRRHCLDLPILHMGTETSVDHTQGTNHRLILMMTMSFHLTFHMYKDQDFLAIVL